MEVNLSDSRSLEHVVNEKKRMHQKNNLGFIGLLSLLWEVMVKKDTHISMDIFFYSK